MNELERKIKELREKMLLSPDQLAIEIGLTKSTIWDYKSGKKQISVNHLSMLADFFGLSVDCLLDRTENVMDLDLQGPSNSRSYNLMLDNKALDKNEIAEVAS